MNPTLMYNLGFHNHLRIIALQYLHNNNIMESKVLTIIQFHLLPLLVPYIVTNTQAYKLYLTTY